MALKRMRTLPGLWLLWAAFALASAAHAQGPHLAQRGAATELVVDGNPFLILGGELGNSEASDRERLKPQWARLRALGLNTLLVPVSWELIEPAEGRFDFASVDGLIEDARAADMRFVLLWFGSWKNSMSTYVPGWVKRDAARFPRARDATGETQEILSAFSVEARNADARTFAALMAHLKRVDGARGTVLMVQVENEIGMLPSAREHGRDADRAFAGPVPPGLLDYLGRNRGALAPELSALWRANGARGAGPWAEVFGAGPAGEEVFTAWHHALYAEAVAAAGKREYALPMFVNAALARPGSAPGEYPSGGPLPHLVDVWKAAAPSIDFLAPDIYFPNFGEIVPRYAFPGNPLFVPEANRAGRDEAGAEAFLGIAEHDALGHSPFAIDRIEGEGAETLAEAYRLLGSLWPTIAPLRGTDRLTGFKSAVGFDGAVSEATQERTVGGIAFTISFVDRWTPRDKQNVAAHGGLIAQIGPGEYLVAGRGVTLTGRPVVGGKAGIERAAEGRFVGGEWQPGRRLNGDETHQGRWILLPPDRFSVQRVRYYRYD